MKVCLNYFNNYPENIPSCPVCSSKAIRPEDGALPVKILLAGRYRLNGLMSTGISDSSQNSGQFSSISAMLEDNADNKGAALNKSTEDMNTVEISSADIRSDIFSEKRAHLTAKGMACIAAAALVLLIGGIFALSHIFGTQDNGEKIVFEYAEELGIPDLSGMTLDKAESIAQKLGLKVSAVDKLCSDDVDTDMIMLQEPANGSVCKKGDIIYVTVSAGKKKIMFTAANYVGMTYEKAKNELENYGVTVERVDDESSILQNGLVTRQSFDGGSALSSGDTVRLWVSVNSNTFDEAYYTVPDFTGISADLISSAVGSEHFRYVFEYSYNTSYKEGVIFAQSLSAEGAPQLSGTEITLYVSKGKEMCIVPDTQYKSEDEAADMLRNAGFTPEIVYEESTTVEAGHVITQSLESGTSAEKGTIITVTISEGYESSDEAITDEDNIEYEQETPTVQQAETIPPTVPTTEEGAPSTSSTETQLVSEEET